MKRTDLFLPFVFLLAVFNLFGQQPNRPAPADVPPYTFNRFDSTYTGYFFATPFNIAAQVGAPGFNRPKPAVILDADGYLFWYLPVQARNVSDFKYLPDRNMYALIRGRGPQDLKGLLLDSTFQVVDSFFTTNGIRPDGHDFQATTNGTVLVAGASDSTMDLSAFTFQGMPGDTQTRVVGFAVQEFDEDHNLLFQWNSNDHIHPAKAYDFYGYNPNAFDYCHGNSIEEDDDGGLLLSFRHLNAVYKVNRVSGQVEWELGGKNSSFTFSNDPGFSGQHDARRLPNGHIALFDNANTAAPPRVSRAVEYALDTVNWVATKMWEYKFAPGFFSSAMGGHQTTPGRLHLVSYGLIYRPNPSFVLVDDAGNLLSALFFQDSFMSYRAYLFEQPHLDAIERPVITCAQTGSTVTLSAPPGYDRYAWSTGENAPSITLQNPGTYQVWVNQGPGMLGSKPLYIADLNNACPVSTTQEPLAGGVPAVAAYFDLLGRQVDQPEKGQVYAVRYTDGRVKLVLYQ